MNWLLLPTLALGAFYAVLMLRFGAGFRRAVRDTSGDAPQPDSKTPSVSVIIAARNEEACVADCLTSVLANEYPGLRDVIVVDDGSTDSTAVVARSILDRHGRMDLRTMLVQAVPPGATGDKKQALAVGIAEARGEVILTTDADSCVSPTWIARMAASFGPEIGYVAGPVVYTSEASAIASVQALEFLGLVAVGAGAIGNGRPVLSNGANAAFRRHAFEAVGGFDGAYAFGTGDDDVLMQRIGYDTRWRVAFCGHSDAVVSTAPPATVTEFVQQRLRWGATAPRYRYGGILPVLVGVYLFYVTLFGLALAAPFVPGAPAALGAGLLIKVSSEAPLLIRAVRRFGKTRWMRWFLPAQALHVPYVLFFPAAGVAAGYRWKGRRVRSYLSRPLKSQIRV